VACVSRRGIRPRSAAEYGADPLAAAVNPSNPPVPPPPADAGPPEPARLQRALLCASDGFWEHHLPSGRHWYSDSFHRLFGFAPGELPHSPGVLPERVHPDERSAFVAACAQGIDRVASFQCELRFLDRAEHWRWVLCRGRVWPDAAGKAEIIGAALTDVQSHKDTQRALDSMIVRFEHVVSAAAEGVFERMLDEERMYVSDRMWQLLGYRPGELPALRNTFMDLLHPDDRARYLQVAQQANDELRRLDFVARLRCKSGHYRWFRENAMPCRLADGRVRISGVLSDIDEQVRTRQALEHDHEQLEKLVAERTARLEEALAQAEQRRREADRANAAKSRFVAHMSHEMRTPLNGTLGLTELALQLATSPAQRRYLEGAQQSGRALLSVIDDVLEFSRLQAGATTLQEEPFDLSEALAEVLRGVMPLVRRKGLLVRFDWFGDRTWVRADAARLRRIATHLIGNAAKFTERGTIALVVEVADRPAGRCEAILRFHDTGPGLDPAQAESVFDAFVQGDASLSRRHGGAGLGLAIARGLAQAMQGELVLESSSASGSTFTLRLDLAVADNPLPQPAGRPGLAWLVFGDLERGQWMQQRLARLGWQCEVLTDLAAATIAARALAPAARPQLLALSEDALAAGADLHALCAAAPGAYTTMLIRPDWHQPALERSAREQGITLTVLPLTPRALASMTARAAARAGPVAPEPAKEPTTMAAMPGHVLLVEDNAVNRLIGEQFLKTLGIAVRSVNDGAAALTACRTDPPRLVLMDVQMPVMDGLEATRHLRCLQREQQLPPFPILALTAHSMSSDRDACLAAGMDAFLTKPLLLDSLKQELARWLRPPNAAPAGS
jgi:PAS domain S-box-containing protein